MRKPKIKWKYPLRRKKKSDVTALDKAREFVSSESQTDSSLPSVRITNDTVARNREEVLSGARRFIYPLRHTKHRIAIVSTMIVVIVLFFLSTYSWYLLYRQQSTSNFAYRISQVLPLPVVRVDGKFIRFEEYLFELRQSIHYLVAQERVDFNSPEGHLQLDGLKQKAMDKVIENSIVKQMARELGITVSEGEITERVNIIRESSGAGDNNQTLENTLDNYFGWGTNDLYRAIEIQLLKYKLLPILDTNAKPKAQEVLAEINGGLDFAQAAKKYSNDDFTKDNGGSLGFILKSNQDIPAQLIEKGFSLPAGEVSKDLVETLFGYSIVKNYEYRSPQEAKIGHILIRFQDISNFINERKSRLNIDQYIVIRHQDTTP